MSGPESFFQLTNLTNIYLAVFVDKVLRKIKLISATQTYHAASEMMFMEINRQIQIGAHIYPSNIFLLSVSKKKKKKEK